MIKSQLLWILHFCCGFCIVFSVNVLVFFKFAKYLYKATSSSATCSQWHADVSQLYVYHVLYLTLSMSILLQLFSHKLKYWTNWNVDLIMVLVEKARGHQSDYNSSWDEHECLYKLHGNPSNGSLWVWWWNRQIDFWHLLLVYGSLFGYRREWSMFLTCVLCVLKRSRPQSHKQTTKWATNTLT